MVLAKFKTTSLIPVWAGLGRGGKTLQSLFNIFQKLKTNMLVVLAFTNKQKENEQNKFGTTKHIVIYNVVIWWVRLNMS